MLYLLSSQKSRDPTSVPMYQPLKGAAVNSRPPQSNIMLDTPGTAYHSKPMSLNHSYLKYTDVRYMNCCCNLDYNVFDYSIVCYFTAYDSGGNGSADFHSRSKVFTNTVLSVTCSDNTKLT